MNTKGSSTSTLDIIEEPDEVSVKELTATMDGAKEIFYKLRESSVSKVVLIGETGTRKTWMARKICEFIAKENHHEPIWISLDKRLDENSLKEAIARQFSIPTFTYEGDGQVKIEKNETIKHKMTEKLKAAKRAKEFILLVLDGQLDMMEMKMQMGIEGYIKENILGLKDGDSMQYEDTLKVLITRRKSEVGDCDTGVTKFKLEPFSGDDASYLLRKEVVWKVSYSHPQAFEKVCEAFQQRSRKPAEILRLARTFNYFANDKYAELEPALETAASSLTELWRYAYDKEPGDSMIDCFWHSWNFLGKHGGVHYNELITIWMMEGCLKLDHTNQIEKAYEEGHRVLMKLIEYQMLEMQEDNNIIVLGGEAHELDKYYRRGYWGTSATGLASVLKDIDGTGPDGIPTAKVLEGITPADGMMKTLCSDGKEEMVSSLLIDGSRLCREVHDTFFGAKPNLKFLAIFSPLLRSPEELSMTKLES